MWYTCTNQSIFFSVVLCEFFYLPYGFLIISFPLCRPYPLCAWLIEVHFIQAAILHVVLTYFLYPNTSCSVLLTGLAFSFSPFFNFLDIFLSCQASYLYLLWTLQGLLQLDLALCSLLNLRNIFSNNGYLEGIREISRSFSYLHHLFLVCFTLEMSCVRKHFNFPPFLINTQVLSDDYDIIFCLYTLQ